MDRTSATEARVAVVTGAASGIGEQLVLRLSGARRLMLLDRDRARLEQVCRQVGPHAEPVLVDLADRAALAEVCRDLSRDVPMVDLLVLNAGVGLVGRLNDLDDADLDHLIDVNLRAPMVIARALLPAVVAARGRILVTSSLSGLVGASGQVPYCATKAGVRGFADALRAEVKAEGVSVTVAFPGGVRTSMASHARRGARTTAAAMAHNQALADRLLTRDAGDVAAAMLHATHARRRRVVIGWDARAVDLVSRLSPGLAGMVAERLAARTTPVG